MTGFVTLTAESCVQVCRIADGNYTGIELLLFAFLLAKECAVFVVNISDELELA